MDCSGENEVLDLLFHLIVELVASVPEKFDAVVFVWVMRSGENDAGIGAERARDVGNARSRQRTNDENIDAEGRDSGHERVLEHVTRKPGVFPKDNFGTGSLWVFAR